MKILLPQDEGMYGFEAVKLGIIPDEKSLGKLSKETASGLKHKDKFKKVNEQLLKLLENDNLIWRKPWRDGIKVKGQTVGPHNYESGLPYRGWNAFAIMINNMFGGHNDMAFLTKKQIEERGGKLKAGASPITVIAFIKTVDNKFITNEDGKELVTIDVKTGLIPYNVYPERMWENVKPIKRKVVVDDKEPVLLADPEKIVKGMPKKPPIRHGGDRAYYSPSQDFVQMPPIKAFKKLPEYYCTLFHELVHSTGHQDRLKRKFGFKDTPEYAFEELVAELGASYLCAVTNLDYFTLNNSAAYLKGWASKLRSAIRTDDSFMYRAVVAATRAAKFIIGETIVKSGKPKTAKPAIKEEQSKPKKTKSGKKESEPAPVKPTKRKPGSKIVNKAIKASTQAAITDLLSMNKYKHISPMIASTLYSSFAKNPEDTVYAPEGTLKNAVLKKAASVSLVQDYWADGGEFSLTEAGKDFIQKIEARKDTLTAKKYGTDLFPELAGTKKPKRKKKSLDGIPDLISAGASVLTAAAVLGKKQPSESKPMSAADLKQMKFEKIKLKGELSNFIGDLEPGAMIMLTGEPGHGKSTFMVTLANEIASSVGNVLYIAHEEGISDKLRDKLERTGAIHNSKLYIETKVPQTIAGYAAVFIDSKDSTKLTWNEMMELARTNPRAIIVFIVRNRKDGVFKGESDMMYDVDVEVNVSEGVAATRKNRFNALRVYPIPGVKWS